MSEEAFEVSGRNEYRYLVQDEDEEVQYARHRQYVSPLLLLSRRCIALICMGVLALLVLATYLGYVAKTPPPGAAQVTTPCGTYKGAHDDLDRTVGVWDSHIIRPSKNNRVPSGRPKVMYSYPELYTTQDCLSPVNGADVQLCQDNCTFRPAVPCDTDIYNLCNILMVESQLLFPVDPYKAVDLYLHFRNSILSSMTS